MREQYEFILDELHKLADLAEQQDRMTEWSRITGDVERLEEWLAADMKGECPVDYAKYGLALPGSRLEGSAAVKPAAEAVADEFSGRAEQVVGVNEPGRPEREAEPVEYEPAMEFAAEEVDAALPEPSEQASKVEAAIETVALSPEPDMKADAQGSLPEERSGADGTGDVPEEQETLVESSWRDELKRAEALLETDLAAAIKLLERVVKAEQASAEVYEQAESLLTDAKTRRAARIGDLMQQAGEAWRRKDWDAAEARYMDILALDEDNQRAQDGLNGLAEARLESERQEFIRGVKEDLRWKQNEIETLGTAVRNAEQIMARDDADEELVELHRAAKDKWDEMRQKMGATTTKMRTGDLTNRAEAVYELEQMIIANQMTTWDATTDSYQKTDFLLEEANRLWENVSSRATAIELAEVQKQLPANPDWALSRLQAALEQQYYRMKDGRKKEALGYVYKEQDRNKLEQKRAEVERMVKARDAAGKLVEKARGADPERALNLMLEARSIWEHFEGIERRIEEQRHVVASILASQAEGKRREAESRLGEEKFDEALQFIGEAEKILKRLSEGDLDEISQVKQRIETVTAQVESQRDLAASFNRHAAEIRRYFKDPHTQQTGIELFDQISQQKEFEDYHRLSGLREEVIAYRDTGAQLLEIQKLAQKSDPNWKEVCDLCDRLLQQRKGGEIAVTVQKLRDSAKLELDIQDSRKKLARGDILEAEQRIQAILREHPEREPELQSALAEIEACKANDAEARTKIIMADTLKTSRSTADQKDALTLYRQVAENPAKSSYTAQAHREAQKLARRLRNLLLPEITHAEAEFKRGDLSGDELKEYGEKASLLRAANLLWDEDEKRIVRSIEVANQRQMAGKWALNNKWNEAVKIWDELEKIWPASIDIQIEARKARKARVLWEVESVYKANPDLEVAARKALEMLRKVQTQDQWGGDGEINLELAQAYLKLGLFGEAERCARTAAEDPATKDLGDALLQKIRDDRKIAAGREEYNSLIKENNYEGAIEVLSKLPERLEDHPELRRMRNDALYTAQEELLGISQTEMAKHSRDGKVAAVEALVRLRRIEKLAGVEDGKGGSGLKKMKADLPHTVRSVIREARSYDPVLLTLEGALVEARRLANQLHAFLGSTDEFPEQDRDQLNEQINGRLSLLGDQIQRLENIQLEFGKVSPQGHFWQAAIKENNFTVVQTCLNVIRQNAGDDLEVAEVREFFKRLRETQELRTYIDVQIRRLTEGEGSLFLAAEDYEGALAVCTELRNRPERRQLPFEHRGEDWEVVTNQEYQFLLAAADSHFDFFDPILKKRLSILQVDGTKQSLLDVLTELAQKRLDDLLTWEQYMRQAETLYFRAKETYEQASDAFGKVGLVEVARLWRNALDQGENAEQHLDQVPGDLSSFQVQEWNATRQEILLEVREFKADADLNLVNFGDCQKNPPDLDDLARLFQAPIFADIVDHLVRAKSVGGDKKYMETIELLEWRVLRNVRVIPPLDKLQELQKHAEKCLGFENPLTRFLGEKIYEAENPVVEKKNSFWPFRRNNR